AVAGGERVDWEAEAATIDQDDSRQALLELEALERLMHIHVGVDRTSTEQQTNQHFWGPFALRGRLGAGRFGRVHRGWAPHPAREVAIKLLDMAAVNRAAYLREARNLARVHH